MRSQTLISVQQEMLAAVARHGAMTHNLQRACAILQEEVGELQKEVNDLTREPRTGDLHRMAYELIQVAATACLILDNLANEEIYAKAYNSRPA